MRNIARLVFVLNILVFSSCQSPVDYVAETYTITDLGKQPGFSWFEQQIAAYKADTAIISQIKSAYQNLPAAASIFVNPSCACVGTQKNFPAFIRVFRDAGIPDASVTIYSMRDKDTKHSMMNRFQVHSLPTFFLTRDSLIIATITDVPLTGIDSGKVERVILDALLK